MVSTLDQLKDELNSASQEHVLQFWSELDDQERDAFWKQLSTVNFKNSNHLFERAQRSLATDTEKLDERMEPIPSEHFASQLSVDEAELERYENAALEEIAKGTVAVLLLAGGQGTRLGLSYPKGMCSVGLPSGKTLLQLQAERIRSVVNLAKQKTGKEGGICWYIMTSGATNATTRKFLEANDFFGLPATNVKLFEQGLLPCFDFDGKLLLEDRNAVALAPDGNGGVYRALETSDILADMTQRGVKYVHVYCVDNILVKVADPLFIGYCITKEAECGAKVVSKEEATEPVGVVCKVDGRFQVVEYSEITERTAKLRDASGNLVFRAGNICNHFFSVDFLRAVCEQHERNLKLHVAKKKIAHVDARGEKVKPDTPNGIKIEKFVFDAFQFASRFVTWEVPRTREFSALKNADGAKKDCPSTARRDLLHLHRTYVERAGGFVDPGVDVEVSPLLSYGGENLEKKVRGRRFQSSTILLADNE
ncbi:UDP-N-acetylhexosamine pyrophosphorylase-like protein 1 [Sitophilus oryzae]|uniref:UDP-N-acetylglucosamine diphosphorylase n=1 Tax=Sitophilus oryzae TaxID=7048 RepID=A0A6J2XWL5_SITOR|nr:UDP-N-acetylhexosamine pyrophosphorylase-like protein 1 [Sitophilus oryzae]